MVKRMIVGRRQFSSIRGGGGDGSRRELFLSIGGAVHPQERWQKLGTNIIDLCWCLGLLILFPWER